MKLVMMFVNNNYLAALLQFFNKKSIWSIFFVDSYSKKLKNFRKNTMSASFKG